jgi:mannan endo-1,4-beta-mannosidase
MRWPARHPHIITAGMRGAIKSMSDFATRLDWRHFSPRDALADINLCMDDVTYDGAHLFACRDEKQALIWLLRTAPKDHRGILPPREPLRNLTLSLRGLAPGRCSIEAWDTRQGHSLWQVAGNISLDGALHFTLPQLSNDLALAISRDWKNA